MVKLFFSILVVFIAFPYSILSQDSNNKIKGIKIAEDISSLKKYNSEKGIGKRYAIIIGINKYSDSGIASLSKARNDAKAIGKILKKNGAFDAIALMTDDADPNDTERLFPTKQNIEEKLNSFLARANPEDMFVFFFSGHGISNEKGEDFLITQNTSLEYKEASALPVNWVVEKFREKEISKLLLVLDACRETVYKSKSVQRIDVIPREFNEGSVSATFYSTSKGHYSYEDDESDFGVFTKYLIYGLEGQADTDDDGVVSFTDLKKFVEKGVMDWSRRKNKRNSYEQKPYTKIYNEETNGDLAITLAKRPKVSIADDNEYSRTWDEALKRSAMFPGLGQHFKKEKWKAYSFGFTGIFLLGALGSSYSKYQSSLSTYNAAGNTELMLSFATTDFGAANLFALSQTSSARSQVESASNQIATFSVVLLGVYIFNLVDAAIIKKPKKETSLLDLYPTDGFKLTYHRETQNSPAGNVEQGNFTQLEYIWTF
ncbi:MAG: caspase family protein [Leptospiraceae bacterium]|nr:caspase family protein [Leptospiraceae bacterium]